LIAAGWIATGLPLSSAEASRSWTETFQPLGVQLGDDGVNVRTLGDGIDQTPCLALDLARATFELGAVAGAPLASESAQIPE
jgi:hypothetical protein